MRFAQNRVYIRGVHMRNLIPFFLIGGGTASLSILLRRKFGTILPLTMTLLSCLCMASQFLFHTFLPSIWMTIVLAVASIPLYLFYGNRRKNRALVFSTGFFAYFIVFLFLLYADWNRIFSGWDELQHWGKMVKEMIRLDAFYNAPQSTLPHNLDYPPFISCFEYLWVRLAGRYSEMNISIALHTLLFSFTVPVISDSVRRKEGLLFRLIKALCAFLIFLAVFMLGDMDHILFTIYTDLLIASEAVYCLYLIYSEEAMRGWVGPVLLSFGLTALLLSKQICILFVAVCAVAYLLTVLFFVKGWKEKGIAVVKLLCSLLLPFGCQFGWNHYLSILGISGTYVSEESVTLSALIQLLQGIGEPDRLQACELIMNAVRMEHILTIHQFSVSYEMVFLAIGVLLVLHGLLFRHEHVLGKDILYAVGIIGAGWIYVIAMIYVYAFLFLEESSAVGSLLRYLSTAVCIGLGFVMMVYVHSGVIRQRWKGMIAAVVGVALVATLNSSVITEELPDRSSVNPNQRYQDVAVFLQEELMEGDHVCIIFTSPYVNDYRMMVNYYLEGIYINGNSKNIMGLDFTDNEELIESMGDRFSKADYVYIQDATGTFSWSCRRYSENEEYVLGGLYKVENGSDPILHLVAINPNNPDPRFWE